MADEREMTLQEWVEKLPEIHLARRQYNEMKEDFAKAIQFLREGKAQFAPNTTNSFVDDLLAKYPREDESRERQIHS